MTNLKRIIDEKGVRQRWLAEQVGVTEVSMSRYVSGERIPKAPLAIRMADVLGVDVKDLYGWDDAHVIGKNEAQPEKRTHERTETHACDCISRQAAIDAHYEYCNKHPDASFPVWSLKILEDLPSAQPDLSGYSDKLWKAAYERGKAEAHAEIVRCKGCKYNSNTCGNYVNCDIIPQMFGRTADNFCSMAERRTDE